MSFMSSFKALYLYCDSRCINFSEANRTSIYFKEEQELCKYKIVLALNSFWSSPIPYLFIEVLVKEFSWLTSLKIPCYFHLSSCCRAFQETDFHLDKTCQFISDINLATLRGVGESYFLEDCLLEVSIIFQLLTKSRVVKVRILQFISVNIQTIYRTPF
jgi:hypothetical protein